MPPHSAFGFLLIAAGMLAATLLGALYLTGILRAFNALSASGQLDGRIGGPSVFPPQPEGVYAFTQNSKKWNVSTGGDRFRRAAAARPSRRG